MEVYRNPACTPDERARDLLSRMHLDEKLAQIRSIWGYDVMEGHVRFSSEKAHQRLRHGIGHIARPGGGTDLMPDEVARFVSEAQHYLIERTRLGIPAIFHEECLMGYQTKGATVFPQIIGVASSWDPTVVVAMVEVIREQLRANRISQALAPVLDVARDARWGRLEETFGEDPYLIAAMATAYIKTLQGGDPPNGIAATAKHFVGYGAPQGGLNWAPAHIPPRELEEVYLFPFQAAVREAGLLSVMNGYHEIDGIPCGSSQELLTGILRDRWGFEGIVVSDYEAVKMLAEYHHLTSDRSHAGKLALEAGIDIELPETECFAQEFGQMIQRGEISEEILDRAVERILRLKFRLGLFEDPYPDPERARQAFDTAAHRAVAREVARKSIVLLKNEGGLLPLDKTIERLAVIGPNADSWRNVIGDYGFPSIVEFRKLFDEKMPVEELAHLPNPTVPVVTILEGIRAQVSPLTQLLFARGCGIQGDSREGFNEALDAARQADAVILVVGGKSGFVPDCTSGEERDRADLNLPGVQEELVKAIHSLGKPVVVVIVDGKPLAIPWIVQHIPAIVEAWLPGEEAGHAVADVLFGDTNPGGKLPVAFPAHVGQVPVYSAHKPSGGRSHLWGDYVDVPAKPLFPFGHGLSYTAFEYSDLTISPRLISPLEKVSIACTVKNVSGRDGDEVVQLYMRDVEASVTRPLKELKGFKRISLKIGEKRRVNFTFSTDLLAFFDRDMKLVVEPGSFEVMVGSSSEDIRLRGELEVEGRRTEMDPRRSLFSAVDESAP